MVRRTDYRAPRYVAFSAPLLTRPSYVQISSARHSRTFPAQPILPPESEKPRPIQHIHTLLGTPWRGWRNNHKTDLTQIRRRNVFTYVAPPPGTPQLNQHLVENTSVCGALRLQQRWSASDTLLEQWHDACLDVGNLTVPNHSLLEGTQLKLPEVKGSKRGGFSNQPCTTNSWRHAALPSTYQQLVQCRSAKMAY